MKRYKADRDVALLRKAHKLLRALMHRLPGRTLSAEVRMKMGGLIFARDSQLSAEVVQGLRRFPQDFPEFLGTAEQIERDGELADGWLTLALTLEGYAAWARDNYVQCQGQSQQGNRRVLKNVVVGYEHCDLAPELPHRQRLDLMALALLDAHSPYVERASRLTARQKARAAQEAAAPGGDSAAQAKRKKARPPKKAAATQRTEREAFLQGVLQGSKDRD